MEISDKQLKEFKNAFNLYDRDGDGYVTTNELSLVLKKINSDFNPNQIESIIDDADSSGTGKISLDDFLQIMTGKMRESDAEEEIINSFKVFDTEGNGLIRSSELRNIMTTLGDKLTDEEVDEMIREADKDGYVDYEEFVRNMMSK